MKEKGGGKQSKSIFFRSYPHNCMPASINRFLCVTFFCLHRIWVQSIWAYLQETCMRPHVCPMCLQKCSTCHLYNPVSQLKSPLCYQKWQALRLICALSVSSKETYSLWKEAYSAEVSHELICVSCLFGIMWVAVCCSALQCIAVLLQCVAVCCSVLQCVLQ